MGARNVSWISEPLICISSLRVKRLNFTPHNFVWVSEPLKDPSPWKTVYGEEGFCPEKCYIFLRFKALYFDNVTTWICWNCREKIEADENWKIEAF